MKETNVECSMSRKGDCWDNAVVESFFKTLKSECTYKKKYRTKEEARIDVINYIEMFYNINILHSSLGYSTTNDVDNMSSLKKAA